MKVVADTNIYVSAFVFKGKPMRLLELAADGEITLFVSPFIIEETRRILRNKFKVPPADLAEAEASILEVAKLVRPTVKLDVVKADADDNAIVECAVEAGADVIVSNDKHLLRLKEYAGISIRKVAEVLEQRHAR